MRYYIIAGEASGDLHGSNLMKGLYESDPGADIRFWGGSLMNAVFKANQSGEGMVQDYAAGAVMGFSQIILHAGQYARRLQRCGEDILAFAPDVVILIDYPGFNFRVAKFAHSRGLKVFYYIAPKVWASRESRVRKLKAWVDKLFIVFPFEKEYFSRKGVDYVYRGNPLIDAIDSSPALAESREDFFARNGLPEGRCIAILPGSRSGEVSYMMPTCMRTAEILHSMPEYSSVRFLVAGAPSRKMADYGPWIRGKEDYVSVIFGQTYSILRHSDAAIINSGTAALEACLIGTPQVVAYGGTSFNFNVAKQIIRVDYISLGNLIAGRKVARELMQYYFTPENAASELRRLLADGEYRSAMLSAYASIREDLGGSGASRAVASAMVDALR